ncbi:MAG: hypothetical protein S4CHLAM102_14390 [Chlamydiia bacterium]|nr:hypothetical protein [Chlamydiia bacterium]
MGFPDYVSTVDDGLPQGINNRDVPILHRATGGDLIFPSEVVDYQDPEVAFGHIVAALYHIQYARDLIERITRVEVMRGFPRGGGAGLYGPGAFDQLDSRYNLLFA